MEKKNIDWNNLGFAYQATDQRYVAEYKDGKWGKGYLTHNSNVVISECAGVLQYAQACFEGLKAYTTKDGRIVTFRPEENAERMVNTCKRLCIPPITKEMFLEAVDAVVKANADCVPPYGTGATLYLRPFVFASGAVIGVKPADEYQFRLFGTPVGAYFKGGVKPVKLMVSEFDRAAPHGTGNIKAGLNYAMSIFAGTYAHSLGYADNMYLDSATRTYVEETGGANFFFVDKNDTIVIPKSPTILPSITRRSLVDVAKSLGMKVEERAVKFTEVKDMKECGLCGTAAVISPVGLIHTDDGDIKFPSGMEKIGPVALKLYETLTGIQMGDIEDSMGWLRTIVK